MKNFYRKGVGLVVAGLVVPMMLAAPVHKDKNKAKYDKGRVLARVSQEDMTPIEQRVRHELLMLPYYGVFDNLAFEVNGSTVTLMGQVTRPTLSHDAAKVVERIEGVSNVENNIEVLPLSPFDDRIRLAEYRAIYGDSILQRYALGANPSIHIIVRNGHVTLEGVVSHEGERNVAGIRAHGVPGVFSVTNNLMVEKAG